LNQNLFLWERRANHWTKTLIHKRGREIGKLTAVYGFVKYRDIFSDKRITSFAYKVRDDGALERLAGFPQYNEQT
jgi:hypothetical protein